MNQSSREIVLSTKLFLSFGVAERSNFYKLFISFIKAGVIINDALVQLLNETCKVHEVESPLAKFGYIDPTDLPLRVILEYPSIVLILMRVLYKFEKLALDPIDGLEGLIPDSERQILMAASKGGTPQLLVKGFEQALRSVDASVGLKKEIRPLFVTTGVLVFAAYVIAIGFGFFLIPALKESLSGFQIAPSVVSYFDFIDNMIIFGPFAFGLIVGLCLFVRALLPRYVSHSRLDFLDNYSIFSIYRLWVSSSILVTLASLSEANMRISDAFGMIKDNGTPYIKAKMDLVFDYLKLGAREGDALVRADLFEPKVAIQVSIFTTNKVFIENVGAISEASIEEAILRIKGFMDRINLVIKALIAMFIIYSYSSLMGLSDIQPQNM